MTAVTIDSRSAVSRAGSRRSSGRDSQVSTAPRAVAWTIVAARSSPTRSRPAAAMRRIRPLRISMPVSKAAEPVLVGSLYITVYRAGLSRPNSTARSHPAARSATGSGGAGSTRLAARNAAKPCSATASSSPSLSPNSR
ncbi:hypothetical protein BJF79_16000 [Actinomadura sp. CNU-125]|nr:hypothetical protein BJF79_16000 [Actinomadura sp. CNU-125]